MNFEENEWKSSKPQLNKKKAITYILVFVVLPVGVIWTAFFSGTEEQSGSPFPTTIDPPPRFATEGVNTANKPTPQFRSSTKNYNEESERRALKQGTVVVTSPIPVLAELVTSNSSVSPLGPRIEAPPPIELGTRSLKQPTLLGPNFDKQVLNAAALLKSWKLPGMEDPKLIPFNVDVPSKTPTSPTALASIRSKNSSVTPAAKPIIQAGEFIYAEAQSAANSEVPAAIRFDLIGHPLGEAWVIADYQRRGEYLDIKARLLVIKGRPAIPINAVIVGSNGSPAVRDSINRQLFKKYGLLFVASFIQGFGAAASVANQSITVSGANSTTIETQPLSVGNQAIAGAGAAAGAIADDLAKTVGDVQPIVKLNINSPVSLFFLEDVFIERIAP
ncbi:MAG: hypothetical protein JKY60_03280 [Kordiimonadaceae bacterium]|nr:hypothetical protein [Kordiimonadaceae bacterium]